MLTDYKLVESMYHKKTILHLSGRLTPLNYLQIPEGLTINIGSKNNTYTDVNIDVKRSQTLTVVASVLNLPFKQDTFSGAYFTEVLEHLPKNSEPTALSEIKRILKKNGALILSTPNDKGAWMYLDPAYYISGHRHYDKTAVCKLIEETGLTVKTSFTAGGTWELFGNIIYCFMLFPVKKIFKHGLNAIDYLDKKAGNEFTSIKIDGGIGIFVYAVKKA
jgi:SAM-dependent methyltransferase